MSVEKEKKYKKFDDLKVRFWEERGHYVINAARVGLHINYGKFQSEGEALAEAELLKARFLSGVAQQELEQPKLFSVADAIAKYLELQKLIMTKSYHRDQKSNLERLQEIEFDGLKIGKHQMEFLGTKANRPGILVCLKLAIENEGFSIEVMQTRRKHWSKFFKHAETAGWIDANPIKDLALPKKKPSDDRAPRVQRGFLKWLQTDGMKAYEVAYKESLEHKMQHGGRLQLPHTPDKVKAMLLLSLVTGIRQGELRGLRRCDYSSNMQMITTRQTIKHDTHEAGEIKTNQGQDREIEIPSVVCAMLDDYLRQNDHIQPDGLIFCNNIGGVLRKNDFSAICAVFRKACPFVDERTGKTLQFTWGDLRHAFASNQIEHLGEKWSEVGDSMGHTNPNWTKKQYGHYLIDDAKRERKRSTAAKILA